MRLVLAWCWVADPAADTRVADILMGIKQGHVLGNTLHPLSIALQEIHNITLPSAKLSFKIFYIQYLLFIEDSPNHFSNVRQILCFIIWHLISYAPDLMKFEVFWFVVGWWSHKNFKKKIEFPYLHNGMKIENWKCLSRILAYGSVWMDFILLYMFPGRESHKNFKNLLSGYLNHFDPHPSEASVLTESDKIFIS